MLQFEIRNGSIHLFHLLLFNKLPIIFPFKIYYFYTFFFNFWPAWHASNKRLYFIANTTMSHQIEMFQLWIASHHAIRPFKCFRNKRTTTKKTVSLDLPREYLLDSTLFIRTKMNYYTAIGDGRIAFGFMIEIWDMYVYWSVYDTRCTCIEEHHCFSF